MAETVTFDVLARDRASATFNRIAKSTENLESRFTRMTKAATGIATTLVGAQVGKSVLEAADKFELSRSRLETITKNIGANFDGLSKQVDAADKNMSALGFTSADTEGALASLESVTRNPTKALKDLALAADIARGRNIGLNEATLILQRVETGHVAQLAKLGIATKDAAGNTLTQAQALDMLSKLYGGAASRYADTFAGKQAAVAAEMKNSAAEIGVALLPAAVDLAHVLQDDVIPPIVSLAHWLDRNKATIEPLAKAVLVGVVAWKAYSLATRAAAEITSLVGTRAMRTAAQVAAASATEAAATRKTAATVLPDLRAMALAEDAASKAFRGRALAVGAGGLGAGALIASGYTGGKLSSVLAGAGTGALIGSGFGLPGTLLGGLAGGAAVPIAGAVSNAISGPKDDLTKQAMSGAAGYAAVAKQLEQDLRDLKSINGNENSPGLGALVKQERAALAAANSEKLLASAVADVTVKMQRSTAAIEAHVQHALALRSAQDGLRSALHQAAQTAADNGKALIGNSDAALANRDAIRNEVAAVFSVIDAMKARNASTEQQSQMLAILTGVVEQNATSLYGNKAAVDALLRSLGLIPQEVQNAVLALQVINTAIAADKAISPTQVGAATAGVAAASKAAASVSKSFSDGFTPVVSKAAKAATSAAESAFNKMKDRMVNDIGSIRDAINSMTQSLSGFADIANNTGGTDTLGASGGPQSLLAFKRDRATQLEQFAKLYGQLRKKGLNAEDLREFFAAGPAAIPAMQELLSAGASGVRQENALTRRIQSASASVARQEAGLENLGLIHRDLAQLPPKLARSFGRELLKLHIVTDTRELNRLAGRKIMAS